MKKMDELLDGLFYKLLKNKHEQVNPVQDYTPIEFIKEGIVKLRGINGYRAILKVLPLNFYIKEEEEIDSIIHAFNIFLNGLSDPIQILCQSKTLDVDSNIQMIKEYYNKSESDNTKEYITCYKDLLVNLTVDNDILAKEFFVVMTHQAKENDSFLEIKKTIAFKLRKLEQNLESCGLKSKRLEQEEIYNLYYLMYNKDKIKFQPVSESTINNYFSVAATKKNALEEYEAKYGSANRNFSSRRGDNEVSKTLQGTTEKLDRGMVYPQDLISSDSIVVEKNYLVVNNRYVRTIFISGISADYAYNEWLGEIYSYPANIDISLHISPFESSRVLDELTRKLAILQAEIYEYSKDGRIVDNRTLQKIQEIEYLRKEITLGQRMFYLSFFLSISAKSLQALDDLTMEIESLFGSKQVLTRRGTFVQLDAFNGVLPVALDYVANYRNIPTDALSTFFPFVSSELSSTSGKPILYGLNLLTHTLVMFDKFSPPTKSITNYNAIICGTSGSGKSFATKLEILRRYMLDTKIYGIDPNSEYSNICKQCDAAYIKIYAGSKHRINIFDVTFYRDPESGEVPNILQKKIANLHSIIKAMLASVEAVYDAPKRNAIDKALKEVYRRYGITDNPASLFKDNKIREGNFNLIKNYYKEVPTLSDLAEVLIDMYGDYGRDIVEKELHIYIDGTYNIFNGRTTVDLTSNMVFFDIKEIFESKEMQPVIYMVLCEFMWEKVKRKPKNQEALIIVDEAWVMMKSKENASFLAEVARQDRKFKVGLVCATQRARDFFFDEFNQGAVIYDNTSMHILMRQSSDDIDVIAKTYPISASMREQLLTLESGFGFIFWGNVFTQIYFNYHPFEYELCNTTPGSTPGKPGGQNAKK